ncbi:minor capsid protein [Caloramator sp. CAR-1]|uniref:minor capsid protein n=1 Tax=Caloramator sp. CAR-1 TaxID=3062777 RepID=UPI0026E453B7|nr:minor capsid protein [Caloramator sp. CAR-1]MDO6355114.1 minor capsid protein [Caloramator sp. CAR-1]
MLLDDIGQFLQEQTIGLLGADIFLSQLPDLDNCIALFEYGGEAPELHSNIEKPRLQVMVRNIDYQVGRMKIEQIKNTLHGLSEQIFNGKRYLLIKALQSPEFLGYDENNRAEFVCNFEIIKEV